MNDILVIGDIMLDVSYIGTSSRLAPEGPIPVVKIKQTKYQLGGAGNVLNNLISLGHKCDIIGVIGNDMFGDIINNQINELKCGNFLIKEKDTRPTTIKNRIFIDSYLVSRYDLESTEDIKYEEEIFNIIQKQKYKIIVFSDYLKGVLTQSLTKKIIEYANNNNIITIVDPKDPNYNKYIGCTIIKPNKDEARGILSSDKKQIYDYKLATQEIINKIKCKICILTLSGEGIAMNDGKQFIHNRITNKIDVIDVTGAGDSVLSGFIHYYLKTNNLGESVIFANYCGQVKVKHRGTYVITLLDAMFFNHQKLLSRDDLKLFKTTMATKNGNKKIIFTNGCFDILHYGHITYLEEAKKLGDILIVGLNSDESIKKNKGESRPFNCIEYRIKQLTALDIVDFVTVFSEDTPTELLKILKPNVLVKGGDYKIETIIGKEYADETIILSFVDGISSTKLINMCK